MMRSSAMALAMSIIKKFEGFRSAAYQCPAGVWTVGWGCTGCDRFGNPITEFTRWSESDAEKELQLRVDNLMTRLLNKMIVKPTDGQMAAITSFAYNVGFSAATTSTLWRKFNEGDVIGAANEFGKWNKAGNPKKEIEGLTIRRREERLMFMEGVSIDEPESNDDRSSGCKYSEFFGRLFCRK